MVKSKNKEISIHLPISGCRWCNRRLCPEGSGGKLISGGRPLVTDVCRYPWNWGLESVGKMGRELKGATLGRKRREDLQEERMEASNEGDDNGGCGGRGRRAKQENNNNNDKNEGFTYLYMSILLKRFFSSFTITPHSGEKMKRKKNIQSSECLWFTNCN